MLDGFVYNTVTSDDRDELKAIHEECLPVKYSDKFYEEVSN
jgi:hypothetical protein